jgi:hypothetical protein
MTDVTFSLAGGIKPRRLERLTFPGSLVLMTEIFFSTALINLSALLYSFLGVVNNSHSLCTVNGALGNDSRRSNKLFFILS